MQKEHLQFFFEGDDYYESLWQDLRAAKTSIYIEVYILAPDAIGKYLKAILMAKALEGVSVSLMYDGIGSLGMPWDFVSDLERAGVTVIEFHPVRVFNVFRKTLFRRDHRKVVLIDGSVGYLGGFNFHVQSSRKYFGEKRWRDTQIRVTGEWTRHLHAYLRHAFGEVKSLPRKKRLYAASNVIVSTRGPRYRNQIRQLFHRYIRRSRRIINITSAYFVPDLRTVFLLLRAKKRGVEVTILTARDKIDVPSVNRANRWLLQYLIHRGIRIFCFTERMLHAKTAYFDDMMGTVGSANVNYRSFFWDLEINAFFRNQKWVQELVSQQEKDLSECRLLTYEELRGVPWWQKLIDNLFYLIKNYF